MNILLVDDSSSNHFLSNTLHEQGHKIIESGGSASALALLKREAVHLIISDLRQSEMDGYQFCSEVRKHASLKQLPIIVYTPNQDLSQKLVESNELRSDEFFIQESSLSKVLECVEEVNRKQYWGIGDCEFNVSENKSDKAEMELRQLQYKSALLEAQIHSVPEGVLVVDKNFYRQFQNKRFAEFWNIPDEIVKGEFSTQMQWCVFQTKNPSRVKEKIDFLYCNQKESSRDEIALINGTVLDCHSAPVIGANGEYLGRIWTYRDVTERKKSEENLRLLNACIANFNDVAVVVDTHPSEPIVVFANKAFEIRTGLKSSEVVGKSIRILEKSWVMSAVVSIIEEGLLHHEAVSKQVCFQQDGKTYWMDIDLVPIPDNQGVCRHWGVIQRDITEERNAKDRIEEQADFLDKARDAILVRELTGKIVFWNKGAERMYGWTSREIVGKQSAEIVYANPRQLKEVSTLTIEEGEWTGELRHLTKANKEIIIESRCTLIRDKQGRPKSILAINTDITERKKIEAQFMRAQRMESIGTLAGGVAHDLNNILAPIVMSIDILKSFITDEEALGILEAIEMSASRGADIVRQVLSFARGLEGQRIEIQCTHVVKELEKIIKDTFPKDLRLQFFIESDVWTVLGDPTQIHQILLNLCLNARDAMPQGGRLSVRVENRVLDEQYAGMNLEAKPGRYICLSVTDTGMGIPAELLEKIFEPFFTTKSVNKGTGLGLSTVAAIVKSHGGLINVYSEIGKGTTFKVYIPAMEVPVYSAGNEKTIVLPRGNGELILVVDDEMPILTITKQTLSANGYRVLTASDGAEAVATYVQNKDQIAAVLTDMMMPIMDGAALIHALNKVNPDVKIVAASGLTSRGGDSKAFHAGIKHFLAKPYSAGTLLTALRAVLQGTEAPKAPDMLNA